MSIIKRVLFGDKVGWLDATPPPRKGADAVASPIVKCSGCGAPILWGVTSAGKRMPLDAAWVRTPVAGDGRGYYLVDNALQVPGGYAVAPGLGLRIRTLEPLFDPPGTPVHMNHWATCPNAEEFKR